MAVLRACALLILLNVGALGAEDQSCSEQRADWPAKSDDVQLMQTKSSPAISSEWPDMGKLKATIEGITGGFQDKFGNIISEGMTQIAKQFDATLKIVSDKVDELEAQVNESFQAFDAAADINASLGDNITKFRTLVNATVGKAIPLYTNINDQVEGALLAVIGILKTAGQSDLAEQLNTSFSAATEKMRSLRATAEAAVSDSAEMSASQVNEKLASLNAALATGTEMATSYADSFLASFTELTDGLSKMAKEKLPQSQQESIVEPLDRMLVGATSMAKKLQGFVGILARQLTKDGDTLTASVASVSSPGFFGNIMNAFSHLFR